MNARFGKAIRHKRSEMHISQEELADRAGLHRTYISDIERGARNPSLESIERLAEALELSLPALFERATGGMGDGVLASILLVEDNPRDVELTRRAFTRARIRNDLHVVTDGAEALDFIFAAGAYAKRVGGQRPHVMLLDLDLPKVDGIEVLRRVKADEETRDMPVVILTVSAEGADIEKCRQLGADSYIVKPVNFHNFSNIMQALRFDWALLKRSEDTPGDSDPTGRRPGRGRQRKNPKA